MSAKAITVRLAAPRDAETLALLSRELIEAGLGWQYDPRRIRRLIGDPDTVALVASEGERVAGFAVMEFGDERAHLILLAVAPRHQRRGVGRRLLEWLLDSARTAGIASVHLELRADNGPAHAFYRAMGFSETVILPGYYRGREPALRMVRVLRRQALANFRWKPPAPDRR